MRFNNNKTCIEFLENGINCDFQILNKWPIARQEQFKIEIKKSFLRHKDVFASRVQFITEPFYKAYLSAQSGVAKALKEEPLGRAAGTFIIPCDPGVVKTSFYAIEEHGSPEGMDVIYMEFTRAKDDDITALGAAIQINMEAQVINYYIADGYAGKGIKDGNEILAEFIMICGFLKHCDIETKIIKPKEKYRSPDHTRYFNETKSNIEILDSRWFTDIVREEGFNVSGHWRLQPYGPGMSQRKLKYINEYEKHGYHLKARKHVP